jgi:VanZ family protein
VTAYTILTILLALPLAGDRQVRTGRWLTRVSVWGVRHRECYAVTDEIHQTFVPTRNGSPVDVLIDAAGAATAMAALIGIHRLRNSPASE